jgi:hypothetical protein
MTDPLHDQRIFIDRIDKTIVALLAERVRLASAPPLTASSAERIVALLIKETRAVPRDR